MKRYIDMVTGLLVIIVIITPFVKLFQKDFQFDKEVIKKSVEQVRYVSNDEDKLALLYEDQIQEIYINKIKDEIKGLIQSSTEYKTSEIRVSIYEDEINYGEIKDLEIILEQNNDLDEITKDSIPTIEIQEVEIGDRQESPIELQEFNNSEILNIINNNYNISKDNIKVYLKTSGEGEKGG